MLYKVIVGQNDFTQFIGSKHFWRKKKALAFAKQKAEYFDIVCVENCLTDKYTTIKGNDDAE